MAHPPTMNLRLVDGHETAVLVADLPDHPWSGEPDDEYVVQGQPWRLVSFHRFAEDDVDGICIHVVAAN